MERKQASARINKHREFKLLRERLDFIERSCANLSPHTYTYRRLQSQKWLIERDLERLAEQTYGGNS